MNGMESEARFLCRRFLPGVTPDNKLLQSYAAAIAIWAPGSDPLVSKVMRHGLDAEAVECYLRLRSGRNGLTSRAQALLMLAEAAGQGGGAFQYESRAVWTTLALLLAEVARSGYLFCKGAVLVKLYGLLDR